MRSAAIANPVPNSAANPRLGYTLAVLNMVISGVAIFVNSLGVRMFSDSTLYTALKNSLVGIAFLLPFAFSGRGRARLRRLGAREWLLLLVVALIGGTKIAIYGTPSAITIYGSSRN